jgi:hypothetical protein
MTIARDVTSYPLDAAPVTTLRDAAVNTPNPTGEIKVAGNASDCSSHGEIARRAYLRAEQRGFLPGHACDDWLAAEEELADFWFTQQRHNSNG